MGQAGETDRTWGWEWRLRFNRSDCGWVGEPAHSRRCDWFMPRCDQGPAAAGCIAPPFSCLSCIPELLGWEWGDFEYEYEYEYELIGTPVPPPGFFAFLGGFA